MTRVSNKAKDFANYKNKWGLAEYSFKIIYNDKVAVVPFNYDKNIFNGELRTVHNLMKRRNNIFMLMENSNSEYMEFEGLQALLEYMLIKKIAL